jgi:hypothetical protein
MSPTMPKTEPLSAILKRAEDYSIEFGEPNVRPTVTDVQALNAVDQAARDAINQALADERSAAVLNLVQVCLKQAHRDVVSGSIVARTRIIHAEADAIAFGLDEDQPPIGFGTAARTAEGDRLAGLVKKLGAPTERLLDPDIGQGEQCLEK